MGVKLTREDIERALSELTILEQFVEELQARELTLASSIAEHERILELLDEVAKSQQEITGLLPIGGGVLVEGKITNTERFRVNIGQNVFVEMGLERCRSWITSRKQRLEQARLETSRAIRAYAERMEALRRFLSSVQTAIREQQREQGSQ